MANQASTTQVEDQKSPFMHPTLGSVVPKTLDDMWSDLFGTTPKDPFAYEEDYPDVTPMGPAQQAAYAQTAGLSPGTTDWIFEGMDDMQQMQLRAALEQAEYRNQLRQKAYQDWMQFVGEGYGQTTEALKSLVGKVY